jgi:hypothetical protein
MIMGELAGAYEAPIYGMLAVDKAIKRRTGTARPEPDIRLNGQPTDESRPTMLWDGEWEITWVTFRDMGAAFGVRSSASMSWSSRSSKASACRWSS